MIIVLNLNRAKKRKKLLEEQFKAFGINDYMFFPAYDARYMTNLTIGANIGRGYGAGRKFQKAELAIIMSHLAALKYAKMMNLKNVIILEDDVVICKDWNVRLENLNKMLPEDWDYVYLSGHSDYVKFQKYDTPTLLNAPKMVGAFSYMVNNKAYDTIINNCMSFMTTYDDMIMHAIDDNKIKAYIIFPFMTYHNAEDSYVWDSVPDHISNNENKTHHSSYNYFKMNINGI